jgi:hypothetical protein
MNRNTWCYLDEFANLVFVQSPLREPVCEFRALPFSDSILLLPSLALSRRNCVDINPLYRFLGLNNALSNCEPAAPDLRY